jgi:hypothetical protein
MFSSEKIPFARLCSIAELLKVEQARFILLNLMNSYSTTDNDQEKPFW